MRLLLGVTQACDAAAMNQVRVVERLHRREEGLQQRPSTIQAVAMLLVIA